ncbi:AAA family ATPase, partial [Roseiarcus sp.]
MRIARLDLTRYGRFTDYALDFGAAPSNGPDFHIVYGLNEAGKSTAAAAILDLLFGVEKQSPYGAPETRSNWHAYSAMRIGARLELAGV